MNLCCFRDCLIHGISRIRTIPFLEKYYQRHKTEIQARMDRSEIIEAFRLRKEEILDDQRRMAKEALYAPVRKKRR